MTYVHGLGDAQERLALEWDRKYGWIDAIEVKCPHCGSIDTPREGFEQTDSGRWGEEWRFECACQGCGEFFIHVHYVDYP